MRNRIHRMIEPRPLPPLRVARPTADRRLPTADSSARVIGAWMVTIAAICCASILVMGNHDCWAALILGWCVWPVNRLMQAVNADEPQRHGEHREIAD